MKTFFLLIFFFKVYADMENLQWNDSLWPDFRLRPSFFGEGLGSSLLIEGGRQNVRVNGTIGRVFNPQCLGKISGEYLAQKLGMGFYSGREHCWVHQKALGASLLYQFDCCLIESSLSYSYSASRHLNSRLVPRKNEICERRIAGSSFFQGSLGCTFSLWDSKISGSLLYDAIKFKNTFGVQGVGFSLGLEWRSFFLKMDIERPYIAYTISYGIQIYSVDIALYGQRVHGLKSIPSSSRIGIEMGMSFGDPLQKWMSIPAVYRPQVLVAPDHHVKPFGEAPIAIDSNGLHDNLNAYFSGTGPLIFQTSPLPPGLTLNPGTGTITGTIDPSVKEGWPVIIRATNYFGTAVQMINFKPG